jgi:hypothetical protein
MTAARRAKALAQQIAPTNLQFSNNPPIGNHQLANQFGRFPINESPNSLNCREWSSTTTSTGSSWS